MANIPTYFIGGPMAGECLLLPDDSSEIEIEFEYQGEVIPSVYYPVPCADGNLMILEGLTQEDITVELINHYRPEFGPLEPEDPETRPDLGMVFSRQGERMIEEDDFPEDGVSEEIWARCHPAPTTLH